MWVEEPLPLVAPQSKIEPMLAAIPVTTTVMRANQLHGVKNNIPAVIEPPGEFIESYFLTWILIFR